MPCRDGGPTPEEHMQDLSTRLNARTDMLCRLLRRMTRKELNQLPDDIQEWWSNHMKEDRVRANLEAARAQEQRDRDEVLRKLTPRERRLLNIK